MVNCTINNKKIQVESGTTIMEAARQNGIDIPHLCYFKELNEIAACRVCVVEVQGEEHLVPACNNQVTDGMVINTNSPKVRKAREVNIKLVLSQHDANCAYCIRSGNCQLQRVAKQYNIIENTYTQQLEKKPINYNVPIIKNTAKCIKCMRCVQACTKIQDLGIWDAVGTGSRTTVGVSGNRDIGETDCTHCGQCITHCPTGALTARDDTSRVEKLLHDPEITTVVQVAPAVRTAWAEAFGMDRESVSVPRMAGALKALGFDYVFDTNFSADLTIMEEGTEFIERFTHRDQYKWPMYTSCCPGWMRYAKSQFPEMLDNISTAKSPQQMFGAVAKTYFAEKIGVAHDKIAVVSIMPCSAKKSECKLETMKNDDIFDVDEVLTTREMCRLMVSYGIHPNSVEEREFDSPLGEGTGAAVIFGTTGGVMDAALRSAYFLVTGKNPDADAFEEVRTSEPWREAVFEVPGAGPVRVAVVSGLANTRRLVNLIQSGEKEFDFVEVMACPGGCVGGGGQVIHEGQECAGVRGDYIASLDKSMKIRFSHENSDVNKLYKEYMEKPCSHKAHHLLHVDHHKAY